MNFRKKNFFKPELYKYALFSFLFVSLFNTTPEIEGQTTGKDNPDIITEEIPSFILYIQGVSPLQSPAKIRLMPNNEIDLSSVIQYLERTKESSYDNSPQLDRIHSVLSEKTETLCKKSSVEEACKQNSKTKLEKALDGIHREMKNRILYPPFYSSIGNKNTSNLYFTKARDLLNSNCPGTCNDNYIIHSIRYGFQSEYSQLYDKIKTKDKNCQKQLLAELARELENEIFPEKCLQEENKNHPVCKNMLKDKDIVLDRFSQLAELVYGKKALTSTEAQAPCLDCSINNNNEKLNDLINLIFIFDKHGQCLELSPGEEKTVHSDTSPNLKYSYNVIREPDGSYSIPLTLKFSPDTDYDGSAPKEQVHEHYLNRVQNCMKDANKKMLGPNGEQLRIVINGPKETEDGNCKNSNIKNIRISSEEHISNAGRYVSDIDCPTITHEVLHLLGLCDEYQKEIEGAFVNSSTGEIKNLSQMDTLPNAENWKYKPQSSYDCRVTSKNSIMSNHQDRWDDVFVYGISDSLLNAGHFNSILYGSCEKKNKLFNECSQLAYKNSTQENRCLKKKQQCEDQNAMMLDKQEEIRGIKREIDQTKSDIAYYSKRKKETKDDPDYQIIFRNDLMKLNSQLDILTKRLQQVEAWSDR